MFGEASGSPPSPPGPLAGPSLFNQELGQESLSSPLKGRNSLGNGCHLPRECHNYHMELGEAGWERGFPRVKEGSQETGLPGEPC